MPATKRRQRRALRLVASLCLSLAGSGAQAVTLLQYGFGTAMVALKLSPDNVLPGGLSVTQWAGVPDAPFGKSGVGGGATDAALGFEVSSLVNQTRHFDTTLSLDATHAATLNAIALTFCPGACGGSGTPGSTTPGTLVVKVGGVSVGTSAVTANDIGWRSLSFAGISQTLTANGSKLVSVEFVPPAGAAIGQQWRIDNLVLDGTVGELGGAGRKVVPLPLWSMLALGATLLVAGRYRRT